MDEKELREILSIFKAECDEHLQNLSGGILHLEKVPDDTEAIEQLFREAHSLKGAARVVGLIDLEKAAHALEDLLADFRKGRLYPSPAVIDGLTVLLDRLQVDVGARLNGTVESVDGEFYRNAVGAIREGRLPTSSTPGSREEVPPPAVVFPQELPPSDPLSTTPPALDESGAVAQAGEDLTPEGAAPEVVAGRPGTLQETIRVETRKLDELMNRIGEILIARIKSDQRVADIGGVILTQEALARQVAQLKRMKPYLGQAGGDPVLIGRLIDTIGRIAEGGETLGRELDALYYAANDDNLRLTLLSADLQDAINRVRMLPLSSLFNLFPRLLRDISRELGKDVDYVAEGGWIQVDKRILEGLKDPLVHIIRNCVDHGIERPEARQAAGKSPAGRVAMNAYQKGGSVFLEVEDDGSGIDLERIRRVAVRRKIISAEKVGTIPEAQLVQLIFHPGFSTKEIITDISGRGVGLDVVLSNIEALKGSVTVRSEAGKGTKFTIKLPLTLATTQALLVTSAGETLVIPVTAVESTRMISPEEVTTLEGKEAILLDGRPILLADMARVLGYPEGGELRRGEEIPAVVISSTDDEVAFAVDKLIGEQEVIIKPLGGQLKKVNNFSGATILGDGRVALIVNVFDLVKSARRIAGVSIVPKRVDSAAARKKKILIADDSLTTRTMEKNILETAGYHVVTAPDGLDAWKRLSKENFDLLVLDVEMPRMDGFELTAKVRKEHRNRELPIVLVTSLDSEEDKRKGVDLGADAYITKKAFEQGELIGVIEQLI